MYAYIQRIIRTNIHDNVHIYTSNCQVIDLQHPFLHSIHGYTYTCPCTQTRMLEPTPSQTDTWTNVHTKHAYNCTHSLSWGTDFLEDIVASILGMWVSYVTHIHESCLTYKWEIQRQTVSITWSFQDCTLADAPPLHVSLNELCHTCEWIFLADILASIVSNI